MSVAKNPCTLVWGRLFRRLHSNSQKRELVAAAIANHVNELIEDFPQATIFVLGDFNVGVSDTNKNGSKLTIDRFSGDGDRYDETHALLSKGLVDDLEMRSLAKDLEGTFVGDDNLPDFPGTGAIDVIYVIGPGADKFRPAKRASDRFGSDHLAVFTSSAGSPPSNISISKLLPNPPGRDAGNETITLENTGTQLTISGWKFKDAAGNTFQIPEGTDINQGFTVIPLTKNTMPLNNNGDRITLLNDLGIQVGTPFAYTGSEVTVGVEITR